MKKSPQIVRFGELVSTLVEPKGNVLVIGKTRSGKTSLMDFFVSTNPVSRLTFEETPEIEIRGGQLK